MKKTLFLKALLLGLFIFSGSQVMAQVANGLMGGHCSCTSCACWKSLGNCMVAIIDAPASEATYEMPIAISIAGPNSILVEYQRPLEAEDQETLELATAVTVPHSICTQLGVSSIQIEPGTYTPDYSVNANGNMLFDVTITE